MKDQEKSGSSVKGPVSCPSSGKDGTDWLVPASLVLTAVIAVNIYIVWYLLVAIPSECANLAAMSDGRMTCGIEPGAYIISGICIAIICVGLFAFVRWNMTRCCNRKSE